MALVRSSLIISFALIFVGCGQQPPEQSTPPASGSLLTADEMAKILLQKATIWKFESKPGVHLKRIGLQFVENGKTTDRISLRPGDDPIITKIIVVLQDTGEQRHHLTIYQENASGSAQGSTDAWFSKPLTNFSSEVQTEIRPIATGTKMLVGGWTEPLVSGKSYDVERDAPCRINLVIE